MDSSLSLRWIVPTRVHSCAQARGRANVVRAQLPDAEAVRTYLRYREEGTKPSIDMVLDALRVCSSSRDLETGNKICSDVIASGDLRDASIGSTLINMYSRCGHMAEARAVFEKLQNPDVGSWNALLAGYVENGDAKEAMEVFSRMEGERNRESFVSAIRACASLGDMEAAEKVDDKLVKAESLEKAKALHLSVSESGHNRDVFVANSMIEMYARCGSMEDASKVFEAMEDRNVVSWNSMVLGYAHNGEGCEALEVYERMKEDKNCSPNTGTMVAALRACCKMTETEQSLLQDGKMTKVECLKKARLLHADAAELGLDQDLSVANTLIEAYGRCNRMGEARSFFERMKTMDVITWNCMIAGYGQNNEREQAMQMYQRMRTSGNCAPNIGTFASALRACVNFSFMEAGKRVHEDIRNAGVDSNPVIVSSLVEFYVRCGNLGDAQKVFDSIARPGLPAWNALMAGYNRKGKSKVALEMFEEMKRKGVRPDGDTYLTVLRACNAEVLVDLGRMYLTEMREKYGIPPADPHYASMIELYGRERRLDEAMALVVNEYWGKNKAQS